MWTVTQAEIDEAFYRIFKSWHSLSRTNRQIAIAELKKLHVEAVALGSGGRKLLLAIVHLQERIQLSLEG